MTGNMVYNFDGSKVDIVHAKTCVYDMHYHIVWVTKYRKKGTYSSNAGRCETMDQANL